MEKMLKAILNTEIKKVGKNEYEFIMSDETIDRDGEMIKVDGWDLKNFKKNSILLWGHRHDIPGIGVVETAVKQDGKLVAKKVRFATEGIYELADTVHGLVDDKVLKAVSVGYIPKKRTYPADEEEDGKGTKGKKKPRVITEEAELYELSIVNVGSHPDALAILKSVEQKAENNPPEEWFSETLWKKMFGEDIEPEQKNGIMELMDRLIKKVDQLCETIEKMSKPKRRYDGLFAGDLDEDPTKPADEEEPIVEVVDSEAEQILTREEKDDG